MNRQSRRSFIQQSLLAAGSLGLPPALLSLSACASRGLRVTAHPGYGPLRPVNDARTGLPLLMLPEGFRYTSFAWAGDTLSDGYVSPTKADGMGVVADQKGLITMVRNHELRNSRGAIGNADNAYDVTGGGTTTLCFNTGTESLERSWVSLGGTLLNCAGGVTPWGTWLSCEEGPYSPRQRQVAGVGPRMASWRLENATEEHGWVFEVPAEGVAAARPIKAMGQFFHEAVAFDDRGIAYQTEDFTPKAGFYRFLADTPGDLHAGGRLQMMQVAGVADMRNGGNLGKKFDVSWVTIDQPEQGHNPGKHDSAGVVDQGLARSATQFVALEGCAARGDIILFTSKLGGAAKVGEIYAYNSTEQTLEVLFESPGTHIISGPDNLIFSPRGNPVICEDWVKDAPEPGQRLMGLTEQGEYFYFARVNPQVGGQVNGYELSDTLLRSEWAGVCYSADGRWMFVNLQTPGVTLAITGPWQAGLA